MDQLMPKMLCLIVTVIITSHITNAQISEETKAAITSGLEAGQALAEVLSDGNFHKSLKKLGTNLKPYLSVLGPMAGIALAFISSGDSAELTYMKKKFEEVNNKLDTLSSKFEDVKRAIDWSEVAVSYGEYERNIKAAEENLNRIYRVEGKTRESYRQHFIEQYKHHFDDSVQKLYDGIMDNDHVFTKNILWAVVKQTKYHKAKVERFSLGLIQLLIQGIKVKISYYGMREWPTKDVVKEWEGKMDKLRKRLESVIEDIKRAYKSQSEKDVNEILQKNYKKENRALLHKIYDFLAEKYSWRYWFVAVYDELAGDDRYAISYCGGHFFLHYQKKKNVVISSQDKTYSSFKVKNAKKLLKDAEDDINGCSIATRNPSQPARTLRDLIQKKGTGGCRPYAMELVVETGIGLWFKSYYSHRVHATIAKTKRCCWYTGGWWLAAKSCKSVKWSFDVVLFG